MPRRHPSLTPVLHPRNRRYVEPAHDALIATWDRVRAWKQEEEMTLPMLRAVQQAAVDRAKGQGGLWHNDPRLRYAETVARADRYRFSCGESTFIRASVRLRNWLRIAVFAVA